MITSRDEIEAFLPERKPNVVILGTMASAGARKVGDEKPKEAFFYQNKRNHFWKIIQLVFKPEVEPKDLITIKERKDFLNERCIAVSNIVYEIEIEPNEGKNPSDAILFRVHEDGGLAFKTLGPEFKSILQETPIFFTCRHRRPIQNLVDGFLKFNGFKDNFSAKKIWHLPSPTRCNPSKRSAVWRDEMNKHLQRLGHKPLE